MLILIPTGSYCVCCQMKQFHVEVPSLQGHLGTLSNVSGIRKELVSTEDLGPLGSNLNSAIHLTVLYLAFSM